MEWFFFGVVFALSGGAHLGRRLSKNRRRLRLWQQATVLCRVSAVESSGFWAWQAKLTARSESIEARITDAGGSGGQVVVVIEGPEGFSIVKLRRQILNRTREIEVGDEAFDGAFIVGGPVRPVHALLNGKVRGKLVRAIADCNPLEIGDGRLRVETFEAALPRVLPVLFRVARQLAKPLDVERRIAENARRDPEPGVRLANLLLLVRERPGDPDTQEALRIACADKSPKVRVRAAIELGEEGRDVLLNLLEKPEDDASCALAVSHLGDKLPFESARDALSHSLRKGLVQTARACVETLGHRGAEGLGVLARVMEEETGELATAAALALGTTGEAAAGPPLVEALQSENSDLREAAAAALERVGSVDAVQPLKDTVDRFWLDLGLRRAARQAIAEIQSRVEGASPGQLSLAEAEAGQLSLAQSGAGQLSLASAEEPGEPPPMARKKPAGRPV